jgi:histidinol-phosphate phosphatase family protein
VTATTNGSSESTIVWGLVEERAGREWCLFLDRDGVINRRIVGDYVREWRQFEWLPGALAALKILRRWAPYVVVVTNQQGIGKGFMTEDDVAAIHQRIQDEVQLDAFQVCPHLESAACDCRKPRPGLVREWLARNPQCDASLSIVVGDSASDLELARNVAATAVHVTGGGPAGDADLCFASLWEFAAEVAAAEVAVAGGEERR